MTPSWLNDHAGTCCQDCVTIIDVVDYVAITHVPISLPDPFLTETIKPFVTVSRKRTRFAQNLKCEFYISAGSAKRALSYDASHLVMPYSNQKCTTRFRTSTTVASSREHGGSCMSRIAIAFAPTARYTSVVCLGMQSRPTLTSLLIKCLEQM